MTPPHEGRARGTTCMDISGPSFGTHLVSWLLAHLEDAVLDQLPAEADHDAAEQTTNLRF